MGNTSPSNPVYEGELIVTEFDAESLDDLDEILEDFVELEDAEDLYVSLPDGERLEIAKLRERGE